VESLVTKQHKASSISYEHMTLVTPDHDAIDH